MRFALTTGQLMVLYALEVGELTEMQAARLLGVPDDAVAVRLLRETAVEQARKVAQGGRASIEPLVVTHRYGND